MGCCTGRGEIATSLSGIAKHVDLPPGTPILDRAEVLAQAPAAEDDRFRVPRILGED